MNDNFNSMLRRLKFLFSGEGTFGRVYLVQHKLTEQFFALKVMKKATIIKMKQISHVHNERSILSAIDCPFIVKLYVSGEKSDARPA
jgi:protein kinase A